MIYLQNRLVPILTACVLLMQLVDPYRGWVILLVCLGGAWLVSFLWARSLSRSLHLRREMRFGWAQVGDRLEERFTLENDGWAAALWVEIEDHSTLPGQSAAWATGVGSQNSSQWQTHGTCTRRGLFTIGPTSLKCGDPFGIYKVVVHDPASHSIMVMPPVVPLPAIQIAPGGRSGQGRPRPNAPERTVSAGSVREYVPGDNLRWIHWRTTARRNKPFVRIFDGTPAGDWHILLDLDRTVQAGEGWDSTIEHGIILAASLADRGLRLKRSVGLITNSAIPSWLPSAEGEGQRWEILRTLALAEPGERPLAEMLRKFNGLSAPAHTAQIQHAAPLHIPSQSSLVLITPSTQPDWIATLLPLLWRGVTPTVLLLDATTFATHQGEGENLPPSNLQPLLAHLSRMGIAHYIISRDLLDRPESRPGVAGHWEWRITPRGRAILARPPGDLSWRSLQ